ncbi:MAG: nitroreductase family protein [Thermoanaerobaculia bacterium]|nr:nitroreductase family protein [Thermoanaerobaculia bacterium]
MDFRRLAAARRSVRAYRPDPVPEALLREVLEAARLAPSACNRQPFRVVVLTTRGREADLLRLYPKPWFVEAPFVLAVCAVPAEAWTRSRHDGWSAAETDAAIATDHLILAAADRGLGTCWVAAFDPVAAREVLGLPDDVVPVAFTPLGWPADAPGPKERRPIEELVRYERW